ncbi:Hypothetical predicted protein [Mytilus galloprovincialis]|uniref:Uncharacterized protein n=1 Tax=Mytilus galloprovincialis TaxID=29158 RepID=A0A8B6BW93_MYTGA|nr:Hypothetical predicted protein [Mytilus galloprovincialis]
MHFENSVDSTDPVPSDARQRPVGEHETSELDIDYIDQIAPDFYKKDVIVGNNRHLIFYRNFWQRQRRGTLTVPSVSSTLNTHPNDTAKIDNCGVGDDEDYNRGKRHTGSSPCGTMDTWEVATGELFHHVVFGGSGINTLIHSGNTGVS